MNQRILLVLILLVTLAFVSVRGVCDQCQTKNPVACHNETVYSLCVNGIATLNYRSCPDDYVCTADVFVCYPRNSAVPSCVPTEIGDQEQSLCGVCGSKGKVFACLNETTVAFCFGDDEPHYESLYNCPEGSVCDLNSGSKFCSIETEATQPSCRYSTTTTIAPATTTTQATKTTTTRTTMTTPTATSSSTTATPETTVITTIIPKTTSSTTTPTTATTPTTSEETTTPITTIATTTLTTSTTTITTTKSTTAMPTTTTPMTTSTTTTPAIMTTTPAITTTTPTTTTTTLIPKTTTLITSTISTTTTTPESTTTTPTTTTTIPKMTTPTTSTTTTTTTRPVSITTTPTTTPTTSTTTQTTTTTEHTLTPAEICANNGRENSIANPNDLTCTEYIICKKSGSSWIATEATCPNNQYFNPTFGFCTTTYQCPTQQTSTTTTIATTESTTTTRETPTTTLSPTQICEANGVQASIPQPGDTTCKGYIVCSKPGSIWIAFKKTCASNKWFDPAAQKCSGNYTCPQSS